MITGRYNKAFASKSVFSPRICSADAGLDIYLTQMLAQMFESPGAQMLMQITDVPRFKI